MKILLATCGSRGDVQPMMALCLALQSAGHESVLLGPPEKALWAERMGCPYLKFGRDVTRFINTMKNATSFKSNLAFVSFVRQEVKSQFTELPAMIENADLIIGSSLVFALSSIAEALDIPYRYVAFTPQLFMSKEHPFLTIKTQTLPKWCNLLTWKITAFLDRFNLTFLINRYRKKMGLKPVKNAWEHIIGEQPIVACDSEIAAVPEDVGPAYTQTGYLHLDIPHVPHKELERFLLKGEKPVYAGFGSMPPIDQNAVIPILISSARNVKKRIIINKFWESPSQYESEEDVFFLNNYPHLHLFSHTSAVIHHGGAGTTAAAAIAGVPQIIVPHILDQYFHGNQIYQSKLGPKPIWRSMLSEDKLTEAVNECMENTQLVKTAEETAKSIDRNRSLHLTVQAIEQS